MHLIYCVYHVCYQQWTIKILYLYCCIVFMVIQLFTDNALSTIVLVKKEVFRDFLGVQIFFIFQSEQALSPDPPTHPNFNVRI